MAQRPRSAHLGTGPRKKRKPWSGTAKTTAAIAGGAVLTLAAATAISVRHYRMLKNPATYRTPEVLRLEQASRFHDRDLAVLRHKKAYGDAFDPHAEVLRRIAGDKYNVFTALHTLGRQIGSKGEIEGRIWELKNKLKGGLSREERVRTERVIDILKRADELPAGELNPLLDKINQETVQPAIRLRDAFYGGGWEKGSANQTSSRAGSRLQLERGRRPDTGMGTRVARAGPLRRVQRRG